MFGRALGQIEEECVGVWLSVGSTVSGLSKLERFCLRSGFVGRVLQLLFLSIGVGSLVWCMLGSSVPRRLLGLHRGALPVNL